MERSFLVLPQPLETAKAIKLATYALVVNFVGVYVPLFRIVALVMLLLAAHRLQHRCKLSHMSELGRKVRWFWIAIVISAMVLMLSVAIEFDAGMLTIQALASSKVQIYPDGTTSVVTTPVGYLLTLLAVFLAVVGLATMILFLLVCRALAIRSNNRRLAGRFKDILWLIVTAPAIGVVVFVGAILDIQSKVGPNVLIVPALAAVLCLLFGVGGQIVASLQLSSALRKGPRHWSEVAAVPGGE